ncbi:MAG: DNA polymerase I [Spirochaetales bacterium]|nr:DNA polymerase I [Spirochaetales bacterium]
MSDPAAGPEPLHLVDGFSLIFRAYFAFVRRPLTGPDGENTSAIFGFFRSLFQLLKLRRPSHLGVIMDSPVPTFRHERYPAYKATRDQAPQDLQAQVPRILEIVDALGVRRLQREGFEADDLIATLAVRCRREGRECYVLSGDKDLLQVVGDGVYVIAPPKGGEGFSVLDREGVFASRGVYPEQIVDYLALTGDSSDNVPGVPGIGEKTAVKLLSQYRDLDTIYRELDSLTPAGVKAKLEQGRESAYLSRELVTLRTDVPLELEPEALQLARPDLAAAAALFARHGMHTLVKELEEGSGQGTLGVGEAPGPAAGAPGPAAGAPGPAAAPVSPVAPVVALERLEPGCFESVLSLERLQEWVRSAREAGAFAFDTETDSLDALRAHLVGVSLATAPDRACYVPVRARGVEVLPQETVLETLRPLLEDPELTLVGQNIKYDYKVMWSAGVRLRNRFFDTMVAAWLLDSERSSFGMNSLALSLLHYQTIHYKEAVGAHESLAEVELDGATDYAAEDAAVTYRLYELFRPQLEEQGLVSIFSELEMPLVDILARMEIAGIPLDSARLEEYGKLIDTQLAVLEEQIFALSGRAFNIRSTRELQVVLFEELGLPVQRKTKTGYSTDNTVLVELARSGERIAELLLEHRQLAKLKSTYVDALPRMVNPDTGRLHTHYLQTGAATGRLASKDPNLQNIPVREEAGRLIRSAFVSPPGSLFLSADYSQIELVVLAHLSEDPALLEAFRQDKDVHRQTAAVLFGVEEPAVTPEQRRIGKTVNFGIIYGMSAFRLARDLAIPRSEAEGFIRRYFARYAGVERFLRETVRRAEQTGSVETLMGRRRRILQIDSRNRNEKMGAERIAVNSPIQGSAADIVKRAMITVDRSLTERGLRTRLLLQVHDELIFEVPEEELEEVRGVVRTAMERAVSLKVPLKVSLDSGRNWGEIH